MRKLTVGQLAEKSGLTRRAIRFYEEAGLLLPERDENGYRLYGEQHVALLQSVKRLRQAGYALKDLVALLQIKRSQQPDADKIHSALEIIDEVYHHLIMRQQSLNRALANLEDHRQELLNALAQIENPEVKN
ncbi:MAG: MerR family transcriptional regulator [Anaerolineae bacterium]